MKFITSSALRKRSALSYCATFALLATSVHAATTGTFLPDAGAGFVFVEQDTFTLAGTEVSSSVDSASLEIQSGGANVPGGFSGSASFSSLPFVLDADASTITGTADEFFLVNSISLTLSIAYSATDGFINVDFDNPEGISVGRSGDISFSATATQKSGPPASGISIVGTETLPLSLSPLEFEALPFSLFATTTVSLNLADFDTTDLSSIGLDIIGTASAQRTLTVDETTNFVIAGSDEDEFAAVTAVIDVNVTRFERTLIIPEPSSAFLLLGGSTLLLLTRRRK